jgi:hypothetical protein
MSAVQLTEDTILLAFSVSVTTAYRLTLMPYLLQGAYKGIEVEIQRQCDVSLGLYCNKSKSTSLWLTCSVHLFSFSKAVIGNEQNMKLVSARGKD